MPDTQVYKKDFDGLIEKKEVFFPLLQEQESRG